MVHVWATARQRPKEPAAAGRVCFELGSWSRLAKFPPTVAGEIGFEGLKMINLRKEHTS